MRAGGDVWCRLQAKVLQRDGDEECVLLSGLSFCSISPCLCICSFYYLKFGTWTCFWLFFFLWKFSADCCRLLCTLLFLGAICEPPLLFLNTESSLSICQLFLLPLRLSQRFHLWYLHQQCFCQGPTMTSRGVPLLTSLTVRRLSTLALHPALHFVQEGE